MIPFGKQRQKCTRVVNIGRKEQLEREKHLLLLSCYIQTTYMIVVCVDHCPGISCLVLGIFVHVSRPFIPRSKTKHTRTQTQTTSTLFYHQTQKTVPLAAHSWIHGWNDAQTAPDLPHFALVSLKFPHPPCSWCNVVQLCAYPIS